MLRILMTLLIGFLVSLPLPAIASQSISLDGQKIVLTQPPVTEQGRTFVPLRVIAEAVGCEVGFDSSIQTVRIQKHDQIIRMKLAENEAYINENKVSLDAPAFLKNGITLVPLRFISENLGLDVQYTEGEIKLTTKDYAKIFYIDVGNGDATYIQLPNHTDILINGGNEKTYINVLEVLRKQKVDDLELVINTHPGAGQMAGLAKILKKYKVERIIDSNAAVGESYYVEYQKAAKETEAKWEVANNQTIQFPGATISILTNQAGTWGRDFAGKSAVTLITIGDIRFLFMGGLCYPLDGQLDLNKPVQVLLAADAGSNKSSSEALLKKAQPETVIISVDKDNKYGFPHADTVSRIQNAGAKVFATSANGTVVVTTDGKSYEAVIERQGEAITKRRVEPPVDQSQGLYVGDSKTHIFHWPSCSEAKEIKYYDRVWFKDAQHALDNGYQADIFCRPE
ncbi:stalk domain-containing protein [Desulfotomaculum sp. 1211_IL3151]|uniref:stalk domain-containing protein n=1 Tax=Desulfotomaculum sp. 1211_IL3151 TaxID=3084055 RepID=UPI002FD9C805